MSAEKLAELEKKQDAHGHQIQSLERTVETVFPPLLEKLDKLTDRLHENSEAITLHMQKSGIQENQNKEAFDRIRKEQEETVKQINIDRVNFTKIKDEVIENRVVLKAVKGLGAKIAIFALTVVGAAILIIMNMKP